jgi:FAD/FMN-containing dehydrogenase
VLDTSNVHRKVYEIDTALILRPDHMNTLADLAGHFGGALLTTDQAMAPFVSDWRKIWHGRAWAVAQPDTPADVAAVVRWCAEHQVAIVPQGGNTGLSGGSTPDVTGTAVVLSLTRLNRVRAIDSINGTITIDAGCILQNVQQASDAVGSLFPLSLAAEGSCTIGGNLATNAGGTAVLRYGTARELCLGIEVVTPQGNLWNGLRGLRKDNSGYDLRDLYIGSEGTLGIITGAVMKMFPKPAAKVAAFVVIDTPADALELFERARSRLDAALTAFELLSEQCLSLVLSHFAAARRPCEATGRWYILIEVTSLKNDQEAREALMSVLSGALDAGLVVDAAVAQSIAQSRAFWTLRENISEAQAAEGKTIKHDIAVPISEVPAFLLEADAAVAAHWPDIRFVTFGHLGDGNLHYNFSSRVGADQNKFYSQQNEINRIVHDVVAGHGGTVSAEHGLGMLRRGEAARYKSRVELDLMRAIKRAMDPDGIMNPGKVLP